MAKYLVSVEEGDADDIEVAFRKAGLVVSCVGTGCSSSEYEFSNVNDAKKAAELSGGSIVDVDGWMDTPTVTGYYWVKKRVMVGCEEVLLAQIVSVAVFRRHEGENVVDVRTFLSGLQPLSSFAGCSWLLIEPLTEG